MSNIDTAKQWAKLRDEFQATRQHASELRFHLGTRYDQVRDGQAEWPTNEMLEVLGQAERAATQKWIELSAFVDDVMVAK